MHLEVSVVIPAYNVARFLEKTIQSVLQHNEVKEIIIVDDGSKDQTLEIARHLKLSDDRIVIAQHENGVNKGRGASRNLGIIKAQSNYIAFLDADDFYLNNRFAQDIEVLKDQSIDGCYSSVGFHFYRTPKEEESKHYKISTLSEHVEPEFLFENLVVSKLGYLHLNGLTVKKIVFDRVGLMNETLRVTQDTDIIFKIAMICALKPASIYHNVALRGVHDTNVFYQDHLYKEYTPLLFESLLSWTIKNKISPLKQDQLMNALWIHRFRESDSLINHTSYWARLFIKFPQLSLTILSVKYFPIIRKRKELFSFLYK